MVINTKGHCYRCGNDGLLSSELISNSMIEFEQPLKLPLNQSRGLPITC